MTYRHSNLYILAMELVRLGDASSEAYEKLVTLFKQNLGVMAPSKLEMALALRTE